MTTAPWPEAVATLVKSMWSEGRSACQISYALGIQGIKTSRSAIQGKLWRMGIKREGKPIRSGLRHSPRPRVRAVVPSLPLPENRVRLFDLKPDGCRYFCGHVGEPGAGFCPETAVEGSSYCGFHHGLCYALPRPR